MLEDFDIREEELEFVAQPYLFELREASKLTILLHRLAQYAYSCPPETRLDYKVLNMDIFLTQTHRFTSEGLY